MDVFSVAWQGIGGVVGLLIGRQLTVITLKQRRLSLDLGLNWPWEGATTWVFGLWTLGLGLATIPVLFIFGFVGTLLGVAAGMVVGFLIRKRWKIDESEPNLQEDKPTGD